MEWENILKDAVKDGEIKELHLKKIPMLKTCDNWRKVVPLGWIEHEMSFSHYKGGLVKLNGKLYFVQDKILNALAEFVDFKFKNKIRVITD